MVAPSEIMILLFCGGEWVIRVVKGMDGVLNQHVSDFCCIYVKYVDKRKKMDIFLQ